MARNIVMRYENRLPVYYLVVGDHTPERMSLSVALPHVLRAIRTDGKSLSISANEWMDAQVNEQLREHDVHIHDELYRDVGETP